MSLRLRLTFLYSWVLGLTLLIFVIFGYFFLAYYLTGEIDRNIAGISREVLRSAKVLGEPPDPLRQVVLPNIGLFAGPDTYLQVADRKGETIASSGNLKGQVLPLSDGALEKIAGGDSSFETVVVGGERIRVFNYPLYFDEQVIGALQVGRSLVPTIMALNKLRLFFLFIGGIVVVLAGVTGWLLAGAALRPIERITRVAAGIQQARDLQRRIEYQGVDDEVGRLAATLNVMLDRLESAYRQLEEANVYQRRFVADASHELRTPLTIIRGNVELLQKMGESDPATRAEALADIAGETERMSRLIESLLALARADAGYRLEKQCLLLEPVLEEVFRRAALLAGEVSFEKGDMDEVKGVFLLANADYLKQLFLILIDNAFKYTPAGGKVRVEAERPDDFICVSVIDTGIGIAESDRPYIFQRFFRSDQARFTAGTGLGLAIAEWIVNEHGGRIEAAGRAGGGSVFKVKLPVFSDNYS
ncbi:MAG: sensor histidine kinase [Peptococcaceae bacterium]|nr:MAG: sensor histidine kinase [Peptococcaceae bacterium]